MTEQTCNFCNNPESILEKNTCCTGCSKLPKEIDIYQIQDILRSIERLNLKCEDNMKRLNQMMLELKGLVCAIRPQVKKSGWYGEEINTKPDFTESTKINDITYLVKELPLNN